MVILISIVLLALGLTFKRSRGLFIITIFFFWTLMTFIYNNADQEIYLSRYYNPELWVNNSEFLFSLLINICRKLGLTFIEYKGIISAIEISLVGSTIWKYSKYPNVILIMYFLCPFEYHVSQVRFALATAVFVFALQYLFNDNSKKIGFDVTINELKYIIGVLIASFIHTSAIFWILLLIAKKCSLRFNLTFMLLFNALILYVISPSLISKFLNLFGTTNRMSAYLSTAYQLSSSRTFGQLKVVLVTAFFEILMCIIVLRYKHYFEDTDKIMLLLKIDIITLIIIGIILKYTSEMYRLQEGLILVNYVYLTNAIPTESFMKVKTNVYAFSVEILLILFVFTLFYMKVLDSINIYDVWYPMFQNNYLYELF